MEGIIKTTTAWCVSLSSPWAYISLFCTGKSNGKNLSQIFPIAFPSVYWKIGLYIIPPVWITCIKTNVHNLTMITNLFIIQSVTMCYTLYIVAQVDRLVLLPVNLNRSERKIVFHGPFYLTWLDVFFNNYIRTHARHEPIS